MHSIQFTKPYILITKIQGVPTPLFKSSQRYSFYIKNEILPTLKKPR